MNLRHWPPTQHLTLCCNTMLDVETALTRTLDLAQPLALERLSLWEAAGRVLAEPVVASTALPPFDYSAMDGYALCTADLPNEVAPVLTVQGESRTGHPAPMLRASCACRIFTGAALPEGADCVVMQEQVTRDGDRITLRHTPGPGEHVRRRGEDLAQGQVAVPEGSRLGAFQLGLIASLNQGHVQVRRLPRVTILCTGDELFEPGTAARSNGIPESNSIALSTLARQAGAEVRRAPFVHDEPEAMLEAIQAALAGSDLLLTVGGVSVGDHDLVRPALEHAGAVLDFWKVAMKPGKPLLVGRCGTTIVLGLPGNPVSAQITFALFGMPLLRSLQGDRQPRPTLRFACLTHDVTQRTGRTGYYRAVLDREEVTLVKNQASGAPTSTAWANALLIMPQQTDQLAAGAQVEVLAFADL